MGIERSYEVSLCRISSEDGIIYTNTQYLPIPFIHPSHPVRFKSHNFDPSPFFPCFPCDVVVGPLAPRSCSVGSVSLVSAFRLTGSPSWDGLPPSNFFCAFSLRVSEPGPPPPLLFELGVSSISCSVGAGAVTGADDEA